MQGATLKIRSRAQVGRHVRSLAVVSTLAVLLASCGSDSGSADGGGGGGSGGDDVCTEDRAGGSITMAMPIFLTTFDPAAAPSIGSNQATEQAALYDTLVRANPDTLEYEPKLAESVTPNDDFTEWTVTLRPDISFPNGDPFDAEAVRASIERHRAPESLSTARRPLTLVDTIEAVDDLDVRFTLTTPWVGFPSMLAGSAGLVTNPRLVEERGEAFGQDPSDAGVGPFDLARFSANEEVVMTAKDDYWDGPVCIDELRFVPTADGDAALDSLTLGEYQMAHFLQVPQVVERARDEGVAGVGGLQHAGNALLMNVALPDTDPATGDVRVRQAIAAAIDVDVLDERAFSGAGRPTSAIVHPDSELSPGTPGPAYDLDRARELVDEAKADGWDGSLRYVGPDYPVAQEAAITFEAMLEAAGMTVDIRTLPSNDHIAEVLEGNYDITWWSLQNIEANLWDGFAQLRSDIPTNYGNFVEPAWDEALTELLAAEGVEEQQEVLGELQEIWNETVPMAIWASSEYYVANVDAVRGLVHDRNSIVHFGSAYVEE